MIKNSSDSPMISAIVAMTENQVIGHNNQLLWHLPADLQHFKVLTTGHPIIMGRKTYESIGKPLPNRSNIIISRHLDFKAPGCLVVNSIAKALEQAAAIDTAEIFVIGGAEIYQQSLPYIKRIYLTLVQHHFIGDSYFPKLNSHEWQELDRQDFPADADNPYAYSFLILAKNNN